MPSASHTAITTLLIPTLFSIMYCNRPWNYDLRHVYRKARIRRNIFPLEARRVNMGPVDQKLWNVAINLISCMRAGSMRREKN